MRTFSSWSCLVCIALPPALVQKLPAGNDRHDEIFKTVSIRSQFLLHVLQGLFVGKQQRSPQGIGKKLAAEVIDEVLLPMFLQVDAQSGQAAPLAATGKDGFRFDRMSTEILVAPLADRAEAFKDQPQRI